MYKETIIPQKSNTATVIVTYNPDKDFAANLLQAHAITDLVVVVDNGSQNLSFVRESVRAAGTELIALDENRGIAAALNIGIRRALDAGKEWILTLDDDSFPQSNILETYARVLSKYPDAGLIGTEFSPTAGNSSEARESITIITSGTLHKASIFQAIGFYTEKLFIDCVDFDFVIRLHLSRKFKAVKVNSPLIKHHLGSPLKKLGIVSSNHSPKRRYFWARNTVYLNRKYLLKLPMWILKKDFFLVKDTLGIIIVEHGKKEKLKNIFIGIRDGFRL